MPAETEHELVHTRQITCRAFRLKNGWLEIEATLAYVKGQQVTFRSRPPVQPREHMHSMSLLLTIDVAYRKLIGLRIGPGFSRQMKKLVGGVEGCTHVTDIK